MFSHTRVVTFELLRRPSGNTKPLCRGTVGSYQWWADIVGDQNFIIDNLLPYFEKSPALDPSNDSNNQHASNNTTVFSTTDGPLLVPIAGIFSRLPRTSDWPFEKSVLSSLEAEHIVVYCNATAQKIIFDPKQTVRSMLMHSGANDYILAARKEVIFAADEGKVDKNRSKASIHRLVRWIIHTPTNPDNFRHWIFGSAW